VTKNAGNLHGWYVA